MAFQHALAVELGLNEEEVRLFRSLDSVQKIKTFITAMPINREEQGPTCRSVRETLKANCCHCIEAAFVSACALLLQGEKALLMDFQASGDLDHVIALYRQDGYWGAISKSNQTWLRGRDAVYKTPRELAMSYFHEYVTGDGRKSLRRFSRPFNIGVYDQAYWITNTDPCWAMALELDASPHSSLLTKRQINRLVPMDGFQREISQIRQFPR